MTKRPFARAPSTRPASVAADTMAEASAAHLAEIRAERARTRRRVLDHLRAIDRAEYSVEVAAALGVRFSAAASHLRTLERDGLLVSEFRPAVRSGLGRRYYRVANASESEAG